MQNLQRCIKKESKQTDDNILHMCFKLNHR